MPDSLKQIGTEIGTSTYVNYSCFISGMIQGLWQTGPKWPWWPLINWWIRICQIWKKEIFFLRIWDNIETLKKIWKDKTSHCSTWSWKGIFLCWIFTKIISEFKHEWSSWKKKPFQCSLCGARFDLSSGRNWQPK